MSPSQIFKLSFVVAAVISGVCQAAVYHGRVDRVVDGDTLIVTTESDQLRVRIVESTRRKMISRMGPKPAKR